MKSRPLTIAIGQLGVIALAALAAGCGDAPDSNLESCGTGGRVSIGSAQGEEDDAKAGNTSAGAPGTPATGGIPPAPKPSATPDDPPPADDPPPDVEPREEDPEPAEPPPVDEPPPDDDPPPVDEPPPAAEPPEDEPPEDEPSEEEPPPAEEPPPPVDEPPPDDDPPPVDEPPPAEEPPPPVDEPVELCEDESGAPISYDYTFGLAGEYSFELMLDCTLGGFISPLVDLDPIGLTLVDGYVAELTDWYRASVLGCADAQTTLPAGSFGLVPSSQSAGLSRGDFDATIALFLTVLTRHNGLPDGVSAAQKLEIKARLESLEAAVAIESEERTHPSPLPECLLPLPGGEEGGSDP